MDEVRSLKGGIPSHGKTMLGVYGKHCHRFCEPNASGCQRSRLFDIVTLVVAIHLGHRNEVLDLLSDAYL